MRAIAVVAPLLAFAVAGCGGNGGGERLSRDAYVAKANAICAEVVHKQKTLPAPGVIAEIPGYVDKALPIIDDAVGRLRGLRPPTNMEQGVKSWLDKTEEKRNQLERLRTAAKSGDTTKVRKVAAKGNALDAQRGTLARAIGLTTCANT